jgi:GNAT superfamily N-acetyltransferase
VSAGLRVRPGRPDDLEQIRLFTTGTFSWGDYVPDHYLEWLQQPEINVAVVTDADDRPIAVARAIMLSPTELWLASVRVDPAHRRQGVATLLNDHGVEWGRSQGAAVARLLIEEHNLPAQRQVEGIGYRMTSRWRYGTVEAVNAAEVFDPLEPAAASEVEAAMSAWSRSEVGRASRGLYPTDGWSWRRLVPADLAAAASAGSFWQGPDGWVLAAADEDELVVLWLATEPDQSNRLFDSVRGLAGELGSRDVFIQLPAVSWLEDAAGAAGFELHPAMVYEKPID